MSFHRLCKAFPSFSAFPQAIRQYFPYRPALENHHIQDLLSTSSRAVLPPTVPTGSFPVPDPLGKAFPESSPSSRGQRTVPSQQDRVSVGVSRVGAGCSVVSMIHPHSLSTCPVVESCCAQKQQQPPTTRHSSKTRTCNPACKGELSCPPRACKEQAMVIEEKLALFCCRQQGMGQAGAPVRTTAATNPSQETLKDSPGQREML